MPATVCSIYEKIGQCDADEWDEIVRVSRAGILMSHAFVAAVEEAFEDQARFATRSYTTKGEPWLARAFAPSRSTSICLLTGSRDGSPRSSASEFRP